MNTPRILATTIASLLVASALHAATFTWDGGSATTNNISDSVNWNPDGPPSSNLATTDLVFDGTVRLTPNFSAVFSANSIAFNNNAAANAFTFGGSTLTIGTGGIVNNDANFETFNNTVTIGTATSTFNAASGGINFSTIALGTNALTFNGTGASVLSVITGSGTFTKSAGNISYGPAGTMTQAWDLVANSGALVTLLPSTDLTVSTTGSITVSGASFNAAGNVTMDGTPLLLSGASSFLTVQNGKTLTLQNGASLTSTGTSIIHTTPGTVTATGSGTLVNSGANNVSVTGSGSTLNVLAGADATFGNLVVGGSGTATVLFDGAGSTAQAAAGTSTIGGGATGLLTFSNGATGGFGTINLATSASSNGQFNIQSGASVTTGSVLMVDDSLASESGTLTLNGAGSSFTIAGSGTLTVGAASLSTASVNVQNSGTFNTGTGATVFNTTGTLSITGGTFNANGNVTLNGGDLSKDATGFFNLAAGRTFTVQNAGTATFAAGQGFFGVNITVTGAGSALTTSTGSVSISGGATVQVLAGGHLDAATNVNIGISNGTNTVTVDGSGSRISSLSGTNFWGAAGGVANVTFSNNAVGNFTGALELGSGSALGSTATVLVQSGADVSTNQLNIGLSNAGTSNSLTLTGSGSTWTANLLLNVGGDFGSTGTLNVNSSAVFNTGTGSFSFVNPTGTLAIAGGTFSASGDLTVIGGQLTRDALGAFNLATGRTLTVQSGGDAIFTGAFGPVGGNVTLVGAGSTLQTISGGISINVGSTISVQDGASVSSATTFNVGTASAGTMTVSGTGASVSAGSGNSFWGSGGATNVTFSNAAAGSYAGLEVARFSNTTTLAQILSGADVTNSGSLALGAFADATTSGTITVSGLGSTWTQTGASAVSIGAASASTAILNLQSGGTFTSGTGHFIVNPTGVVNIDGGTLTLNGPITNNGTLNFNAGALNLSENFTIGIGGLLGTSLTLDSARHLSTTGTTTIDSFRVLTLNGGTLTTAALVNNGTIAFNSGTLAITGAGGFDIGTGALGANVTLGTGANLQVTNTATVASSATLTVDGGSAMWGVLNNSGLVEHVRGALIITGNATNLTGADFFAAKPLSVGGVFTNQSGARLTLQNGTGRINGAGSVINAGLLTGDGVVAVPVTNSSTGDIRAELGKTLYFTNTFSGNSGDFILQGGTLDFTNAITNDGTGFISGHGALNTGGLTNAGVMAFSGGNTDIRGDVVNASGARIVTSGAGVITTFYDDVIHNGMEIFTGANASTVFYGSQSGAGPFTGTGTVYFIGDLRPGNSPALVSYGGDVAFGGASNLDLEIGGLVAGTQYDRLNIAGTLFEDGVLDVTLYGGFTPDFGDAFDLFDAGAVAGSFDAINLPDLAGDLEWDATNLQSTGQIRVVPEPGIGALLASALALLGFRVARSSRALVSASRRNELPDALENDDFTAFRAVQKVREGGTPSPARGMRALPGNRGTALSITDHQSPITPP